MADKDIERFLGAFGLNNNAKGVAAIIKDPDRHIIKYLSSWAAMMRNHYSAEEVIDDLRRNAAEDNGSRITARLGLAILALADPGTVKVGASIKHLSHPLFKFL